MPNDEKLEMTFQPSTIQHLGLKMYSQAPAAIVELIANAYDADATCVAVNLYDRDEKKITVIDDGRGMKFSDINEQFLKIGRNRRENAPAKTPKGRFPSGKKGLGKLALFGLGDAITVKTKSQDEQAIEFSLQWSEIKNQRAGNYNPKYKRIEKSAVGTSVTISALKRSSRFNREAIVTSLSKLINYLDKDFKIVVRVNDENPITIDAETKFEHLGKDIEFTWHDFTYNQYAKDKNITGKIITTKKPLKAGMRGIALYARGRLVNVPEFYGDSDSSHFYTYATGILNVDFIDEHHGEDDLIATNRQALNWEHEITEELKKNLQKITRYIQTEWRTKRRKQAGKNAEEQTGIAILRWVKAIPQDKRQTIKDLIKAVDDNDSLPYQKVLTAIHTLAPEYAEFHWRYLHKKLQKNSTIYLAYKQNRFYDACAEAVKVFTAECRQISHNTKDSESDLMKKLFQVAQDNPDQIKLIKNNNKLIYKNIQNGYCSLAQGMYGIFRNVEAHNTRETVIKYITEKDCLDILSLVSHLLDRLDRRIART